MKKVIFLLLFVVLLPGLVYAGVEFTNSTDSLVVNGIAKNVQLYKYNGSNYLPLRTVAEALNLNVDYKNGRIIITPKDKVDIEVLKNSCVTIRTNSGTGSGIIWDYNGKILTCYTLVQKLGEYNVIYDDDEMVALSRELVRPTAGATLMRSFKTGKKPVKIGDSDEVRVGDEVILISTLNGKNNTVSTGKVLKFEDYNNTYGVVITAPVDNESSGGAVFNTKGELVGMIKAGYNKNKESFFIPVNDIRKALSE